MKRRLLVLAMSFIMVFTMMPILGAASYAAEEKIPIDKVEIDVTLPHAGATPQQTFTVPEDAHYTVTLNKWLIFEGNVPTMNPTDTFIAGNKYKVWVNITPDEGYELAEDCDYGELFTIDVENPKGRQAIITASHHDWSWVNDENGTTKHQECSLCDAVQYENTLISHEHTLEYHAAVPSTCTTEGYAEYYQCTDPSCNMLFRDEAGENAVSLEELKKNLASHNYEWVYDIEPTETENGTEHQECTVCHNKINEGRVAPALSKLIHEVDLTDIIKPVYDGNTPQQTFDVPADAKYTVILDYWYLLGESYPHLTATDRFEEGEWYALRLEITPKDDNVFAHDCTFPGSNSYGSHGKREYRFQAVSHNIKFVADKPATATADGYKAHYECVDEGCDQWFKDADGNEPIENHSDYIIPKASNIKLSTTSYTYNGYSKTPSVTVKDANGKPLTKDTDYTVSYSNNKNIGTATATVTGKGNYSFTKKLTFTIKAKDLASTSKVYVSLCGYDDVKVSWNSVSGAGGYYVYYKRSTSKSYTYAGKTTSTSYKIYNFTDGAKYTFRVYPCVKDGNGYHKDGSYRTSSEIYMLKKVTSVKAVRSGTKVKVSWSNISGESGYQISRSTKKTGTNIVKTYSTTSGKYYKVSATKGKTYYYKVRAYKTVNGTRIYAPWSTVVKYRR